MMFKSDVRKMRDNPTYGRIGTDGLFEVVILKNDSTSSIPNWRLFETTTENVTYEEGLQIERKRLDELEEQFKDSAVE
jgi:hypothetical protein